MTYDESMSKRPEKTSSRPARLVCHCLLAPHGLLAPHDYRESAHKSGGRASSGTHLMFVSLLCGLLSGCAALTNPVANGVPVRRLPPELLGEPKEGAQPLP